MEIFGSCVTTVFCALSYCCNNEKRCNFSSKHTLYAKGRDSNSPLCGKCKEGYLENFSSIGVDFHIKRCG